MGRTLLGQNHPDLAICLAGLARLYTSQLRFAEAETIVKEIVGKQFQNPQVQITFGARASSVTHSPAGQHLDDSSNERLEQLEKENKALKKELLNLRAKQKPTIELPEGPRIEPVDEGKPGPVK